MSINREKILAITWYFLINAQKILCQKTKIGDFEPKSDLGMSDSEYEKNLGIS